MSKQILVLGATGMLGQSVAHCVVDKGQRVRLWVRRCEKARQMFGDMVEIVEGSALKKDNIQAAMTDCSRRCG